MAATFNAPVPLLVLEISVPNEDATTDYTTTRGLKVTDAWALKTVGNGGGAATVSIGTSGGVAIVSPALALGAAVTIARALGIQPATQVIPSGGGLRVVSTQNTNTTACLLYVSCIPA